MGGPFILAVGAFIIIGIADIIFVLADQLINKSIPLLSIIQLLIFKIPSVLVTFFPMAILFSVMLIMFRMARDNELTIYRAQGINLLKLIIPVIIFAMFITSISYLNNEYVVPWANHKSNNIIRKSILKKSFPNIGDNVFFKDSEDRIFYINRLSEDQQSMSKVTIIEASSSYPRTIMANTASLKDNVWNLFDGVIHDFDVQGHLTQETTFLKLSISLGADVNTFFENQRNAQELSSKELRTKIDSYNRSGIIVPDLEIEYYLKHSLPFSCIIFTLFGLSFCLTFVKTPKDWWGIISATVLAALTTGLFITMTAVFRALGKGGLVYPLVAAWGTNLIFAIISSLLIIKKANK